VELRASAPRATSSSSCAITDPVKRVLTGLGIRATRRGELMPINTVPEKSEVAVSKDILRAPPAWLEFFRGVFFALFGWKRSYTATTSIDFGLIGAAGQLTAAVAVPGARAGDAVLVSAQSQVNGLGVFGYVSANDVVTIVRFNYSAGAIDPAADNFRILVFQQ
jgi:hypothetical protein